jgi:hypothetical protein
MLRDPELMIETKLVTTVYVDGAAVLLTEETIARVADPSGIGLLAGFRTAFQETASIGRADDSWSPGSDC